MTDIDDAPVGLTNAEAHAWVMGYEACAEAVLDLWNNMSPGGGWIPGGAHAELARVLKVEPHRTLEASKNRKPVPEAPGSY